MAIWAINRTSIALNLALRQLHLSSHLKDKFIPILRDNYDGELLAVRVTPDQGRDFTNELIDLGFRGPEAGIEADFAYIAHNRILSKEKPRWLQIMKVEFSSSEINSGFAWTTRGTEQGHLYGHPRGVVFRIGVSCTLRPFMEAEGEYRDDNDDAKDM